MTQNATILVWSFYVLTPTVSNLITSYIQLTYGIKMIAEVGKWWLGWR